MKLSTLLFIAMTLAASTVWAEDMVVIVNPKNETKLTREIVASFYMGDAKAWPGGLPVKLLDLPEDSSGRTAFDKLIVGKSVQQLKDIWMKNTMAGKADPPKQMDNDAEVKKAVAASRYAMGYIKASSVDESVRVAFQP